MARRRNKDRSDEEPEDKVPGELEHASGEVDEFNAAVRAGAGGEGEPADERELEEQAMSTGGAVPATAAEPAAPGQPTKKGPARFAAFLRASWAELQRVQWPDRVQVAQGTAVVLGFVVLAGGFLGLADVVASEVVDFIL